jgi:hypothetical protein
VRVEAKWLVQNLTDTHVPEVKFTAEVVGKSGAEIGDAGGYEELRQGATAVIGSSTYSKEKKLKGAVVHVGARVMAPTATGSSEHIGMALSASDHMENDDENPRSDGDDRSDNSSDDEAIDKSTLTGVFSLQAARVNAAKFGELMQDIGYEESDILGSYFKEDPRFDPEGHTGLSGAWDNCMTTRQQEKSKKILDALQAFQHKPDIYTLWKYTLLNKYAPSDLLRSEAINFPSPFMLLEQIGGNIEQCLEAMRETRNLFQSQQISEQSYSDAMKSLALCHLAASFEDEDPYSRVRQLVHLIGNNDPVDGVCFDGGSWGEGEHMQGCRRVVEELSEVRLEVPDGVDTEQDAYLDSVDWNEVADRVYSHLA